MVRAHADLVGTTRQATMHVHRSHDLKTRVLVVDDDALVLRALARGLRAVAIEVLEARDAGEAEALLESERVDAIVSDVFMPGVDGMALLRRVRERDPDVPFVLLTGQPELASATEAVALGAFHYLTKPVTIDALHDLIRRAVDRARLARDKAAALEAVQRMSGHGGLEALDASFARALDSLWIAWQPIVRHRPGDAGATLHGHEAFVRSDEATLLRPDAFLGAAERLERLHALGRRTRSAVAGALSSVADGAHAGSVAHVNLHPHDLLDARLFDPAAPLSTHARRVVLEITERASLDDVPDLPARVRDLRALGFRIAIDDIGAGYAGLASFAALEPDVVKLDLTLVRDIDRSPTRQRLAGSILTLCRGMDVGVVAEGIESAAERDCLVDLGCELFQGYLFARPGHAFPTWSWG
ncbi:MAG: EAL domain-containing response regulator [Deltaproteobacteria bacterium]|nr:EAL domain-containing response regulator [Deltaproteobacteria bacterium]